MNTLEQLLLLRELIEQNPHREFMCHVAEENYLFAAQEIIQARILSYNQDTSCLICIYNGMFGTASHLSPKYQAYRLKWLDSLIKEHE